MGLNLYGFVNGVVVLQSTLAIPSYTRRLALVPSLQMMLNEHRILYSVYFKIGKVL